MNLADPVVQEWTPTALEQAWGVGLSTGDDLKVVNRSVNPTIPFLYMFPPLCNFFNHLYVFQFSNNETF